MLNFLKGKKTYILGLLMVLTAIEQYITGDITLSQLMMNIHGVAITIIGANGLGFITLRAAISKVEKVLKSTSS